LDVYLYSVPGEELIEITKYPIELVREVEHDTDIGILYTRWRYLGSPPHKKKFKPQGANAACFRVSSQLPIDYVYTSTDEPIQILPMRKFGGEFGSDLLQKQTMDDLLQVKESCEPVYQQVIHRIGRTEMCFRRILLPVVDGAGQVDLIYSATRRFGTVDREFFELEIA
jgi:hypothetical protein